MLANHGGRAARFKFAIAHVPLHDPLGRDKAAGNRFTLEQLGLFYGQNYNTCVVVFLLHLLAVAFAWPPS